MPEATTDNVVLLCFDGSENAAAAIAGAGRVLGPRSAVVIVVDEPSGRWESWDPATVLDAPVGNLLSRTLNLEEIAGEVVHGQLRRGIELARTAGFRATGRVARGKPWRAICHVADEIDAGVIVLGARGLSLHPAALLGSVSLAVTRHAGRPTLIVPDARRFRIAASPDPEPASSDPDTP